MKQLKKINSMIEQYYLYKENIHLLRINNYYNVDKTIDAFIDWILKSENNVDHKLLYYNKFHLANYKIINPNKSIIEI